MSKNGKGPTIRYEIYIGAPVASVWRGLTDGELTKQYVYGTRLEARLERGGAYAYLGEGGVKMVDGQILELEPQRRLAMSWRAHWDPSAAADRASRVTYELAAAGPSTRLSVVHDDFDAETATYRGSLEGWPLILSSLKTLLESGRPLAVGAP